MKGEHACPLSQPRYLCMGGLLQKERKCLLSLLQPRHRTMSHHQSVLDENAKDTEQPFKIEIGDVQELWQRITSELGNIECKVLNFENRYKKVVRPMLSSRGLIAPNDLRHPSTLFLHRQTFKIVNHNPSYLSSFDVMAYEDGIRDKEEWKLFLQHMVEKRVYVIEDWDSTISTVETLMYDHGLKGPEDGSEVDFQKAEFDASYNNGTARLSFIIWKADKIIYSKVYTNVSCSSAMEAEAFAAFALLSKAHEKEILKLVVCSDCKPVCKILSGELSIGKHHNYLNLYLMLRSMKRHFDKLIVMWKPRELMVIVDDLAKASNGSIVSTMFPKVVLQRWLHHLKGLPVFRIERTEDTNKKIAKLAKIGVEESYGKNEVFIFFVEVEDQYKFDALLGLKQSFRPNKLNVSITDIDDKSDFNRELEKIFYWVSKSGQYNTFIDSRRAGVTDMFWVVVFDAAIPKEAYYQNGAFHVILVTPNERKGLTEKGIPELNALAFVYFNGVRFPLNNLQRILTQGKKMREGKTTKESREKI